MQQQNLDWLTGAKASLDFNPAKIARLRFRAGRKPKTIRSDVIFPPTLHHLPVDRPAEVMPWD